MGKLKLALILLLTFGVIALGLLFPRLSTQIVDAVGIDAVYSSEISVKLPDDQQGSEPADPVDDILYKLRILQKGSLVPLSDHVASRSVEEVEQLGLDALRVYQDAMLVNEDLQIHPSSLYLSVDPNDPEEYFMVWMVRFSNSAPSKDYYNFEFLMDDETGTILQVDYTTSAGDNDLDSRMERLTGIFFSGLGLNAWDYYERTETFGTNKTYLQSFYILPGANELRTRLCFEMDVYYFKTSTSQYNVNVVEP